MKKKSIFSFIIFIQQDLKGRWRALYQNIGYFEKFLNEPQKLVKDEVELFVGKGTYMGGTCVPVNEEILVFER